VGTRVATSFLRFGQLEIFAQRRELDLLLELVQHALKRDFAHLNAEEALAAPHANHREEAPDDAASTVPDEEPGHSAAVPASPTVSCSALHRMFDDICRRQALLVAEWRRVGYCQGNMNSDNAALGGVTLDYGPFAFMERYDTFYNPWVGGGRAYSFGMQHTAALKNLETLGAVFSALALEVRQTRGGDDAPDAVSEAEEIEWRSGSFGNISRSFGDVFHAQHADNCRAKLGLAVWDGEAEALFDELTRLMHSRSGHRAAPPPTAAPPERAGWRMPFISRDPLDPPPAPAPAAPAGGVDFTLLFRTLGTAELAELAADEEDSRLIGAESELTWPSVRALLQPAALDSLESWPDAHLREWTAWTRRYWRRVRAEGRGDERLREMANANPKYVLRNWMAAAAYEAAERGDYSIVSELLEVLGAPYDELSASVEARWAQMTPQWARGKAGLAFMT